MNERIVILDTCVLVDIMRGKKKDLASKVRNLDLSNCGIADLTRFELLCGAEESAHKDDNIKLTKELCLQFKECPTSLGYDLAAKEKVRLRKEGISIPDIDLLIGCLCSSQGFLLVTGNVKHMERIEGITIIPW